MAVDKVYKVVGREWHSSDTAGDLMETYPLGVVVRPKVGKLFAYGTLDDARLHLGQKRLILECEADVFDKSPQIRLMAYFVADMECVKKFWNLYPNVTSLPFGSVVGNYSGTVLCDWIQPIRRIL
jgi:hypothetical protein